MSLQLQASLFSSSASLKPTSSPTNTVATNDSASIEDEDDLTLHPWEREGWVPKMKSGKQISPNQIRNQLQKYIDECKANGTATQTSLIEKMSVNNNTFRKFMNPKTYKNQWSACQNGPYWAGAKLLEQAKYYQQQSKKQEKSAAGKRKAAVAGADEGSEGAGKNRKVKAADGKNSKAVLKAEAENIIERIKAVDNVSTEDKVYDTCPQVVANIKGFLAREGVTKAMVLEALGGINSNSLNRFLSGKKQDQCGNVTYEGAYIFFEKLRILEGKTKSQARLKNERENPGGFSLVKARSNGWMLTTRF